MATRDHKQLILSALQAQRFDSIYDAVVRTGSSTPDGWVSGYCPFHEGHNSRSASFSFNVVTGASKCHGACAHGWDAFSFYQQRHSLPGFKETLRELAVKLGVGMPPERLRARAAKAIEAVYYYTDATGTVIHEKYRDRLASGGKSFRWHDVRSGLWHRGPGPVVPYRLHELAHLTRGSACFLLEGEKCVDAVRALGLPATCSPDGAGKWGAMDRATVESAFRDLHVVILPDNDPPGEAHALEAAAALAGVAREVRLLRLEGLSPKGDVADWLAAGHSRDELVAAANSAPPFDLNGAASPARARSHQNPGAAAPGPQRLELCVTPGNIPTLLHGIQDALLAQGPPAVFQRGGLLVHIAVARTVLGHDSLHIRPASIDKMTAAIEAAARLYRVSGGDGEETVQNFIDVTRRVAAAFLSLGEWRLPPLRGITHVPIFRPDGSVHGAPGYDPATGLFFDPLDATFPPPIDHPSLEDARAALGTLLDALSTFPFESEVDRAAALAALLTALVRHSLRTAPLFAISAPAPGAGKSLLVDLISIIATGQPAPALSLARDPEEQAKRLLSVLVQGIPLVSIDNVEHPLSGDALCSVLTQAFYRGRPLGQTAIVDVPTNLTWFATGNNVQVRGDLSARVIRCKIDPQCERPEDRAFERDLYDWGRQQRGQLAAAGLTVLKAYASAGRPPQPFKSHGRFPEWSHLVRSSLSWLGLDDPLRSLERVEIDDEVHQNLAALLHHWRDAQASVGMGGLLVRDALKIAEQTERQDLRDAIGEIVGTAKDPAKSLGRFLQKHQGRRVSGLWFIGRVDKCRNTVSWCVEGNVVANESIPFDSCRECE